MQDMQISATQIDVLLDRILRLWPRLRATAALPDETTSSSSSIVGDPLSQCFSPPSPSPQQSQRDLTLIPQAMQAEEDLLFYLRQYRGFKAATFV